MKQKIETVLGLDIGSNSVGSCWIDLANRQMALGVGHFPAGVDETSEERGDPLGRERRGKRLLRRVTERRAERRRKLLGWCIKHGFLPADPAQRARLLGVGVSKEVDGGAALQSGIQNPWQLRREALTRVLKPHEFARVLMHINQHRGAMGLNLSMDVGATTETAGDEQKTKRNKKGGAESDVGSDAKGTTGDKESKDEKNSRLAWDHTRKLMHEEGASTLGELVAKLIEKRRTTVSRQDGSGKVRTFEGAVRNRANLLVDRPGDAIFATRELVRLEFLTLWKRQKELGGPLAAMLTDERLKELDNPTEDEDWRHRGIIFGQRRTKWDLGRLGRCDLEPTDRRVPHADRHASYFRVIESVNNIRVLERGKPERSLTKPERDAVIEYLRTQKAGSVAGVRKALGFHKKEIKEFVTLNIENDKEREINTDWFYREVVIGAIGRERWESWEENKRESVNRAILSFDTEIDRHAEQLSSGAVKWWGLSEAEATALVAAWQRRPKLDKRLSLSRRAVLNLMHYMDPHEPLPNGLWPDQMTARQLFSGDGNAIDRTNGKPASPSQRDRYSMKRRPPSKAERRFLRKHQLMSGGEIVCDPNGTPIAMLPLAPTLTNPVVRKAIHEVRRHVIAYLRKFKRVPERIVIEYAREATQPKKVRDDRLALNRRREQIRKQIIDDVIGEDAHRMTSNQLRTAVQRVVLARQQRNICVYSGQTITDDQAALGEDCEIDHIVPYSAFFDDSLNNKVLVKRGQNRGKGKETPKTWPLWKDNFEEKSKFAASCFEKPENVKGSYFTYRDYARKWDNFNKVLDKKEMDDFRASQLTDTAYAAKEVTRYLWAALYPQDPIPTSDEPVKEDRRRILTTKGVYTAILRRDWQLFREIKPRGASHDEETAQMQKNRGDYRHNAIDAAVIALTDPAKLQNLAAHAEACEEARGAGRPTPKRVPISPPWHMTPQEFRRFVLSRVFGTFRSPREGGDVGETITESGTDLIVCHRTIKRRLKGHLHKDTLYGAVMNGDGTRDLNKTTNRLAIEALKPAHLNVPEGWDSLSAKLDDSSISGEEKAAIKKQLVAMEDVPPGKGGIVRDRYTRDRLRKRLRDIGLDPDEFSKDQIIKAYREGKITLPNGNPVKRVVLLRTNNDPVVISRWQTDPATGKRMRVFDAEAERHGERCGDPRAARIYDSQNNHHIEIRTDSKGRWFGEVVSQFTAASRNAARQRWLREQGVGRRIGKQAAKGTPRPELPEERVKELVRESWKRFPMIDRSDREDGSTFVMSLSEGETVYMLDENTGLGEYFVVVKIDKPQTVWFTRHWDARGASEKKDADGKPISGSKREAVSYVMSKLRDMKPPQHPHPVKVRVGPLGDVKTLTLD